MVVIDGYTFVNGKPVKVSDSPDSFKADLTPVGGIRRAIRGSAQKSILKKTNFKEFSKPFILKDGYCIGKCEGCELSSSCNRSIVVKDSRLLAVTFDISSQEPLIASFVHKVPRWQKVFRNLNIRKLGLDWFLNIIAKEYFYIDVEIDHPYWNFLADIENSHEDFLKLCEDSYLLQHTDDSVLIRSIYEFWAKKLKDSLNI